MKETTREDSKNTIQQSRKLTAVDIKARRLKDAPLTYSSKRQDQQIRYLENSGTTNSLTAKELGVLSLLFLGAWLLSLILVWIAFTVISNV